MVPCVPLAPCGRRHRALGRDLGLPLITPPLSVAQSPSLIPPHVFPGPSACPLAMLCLAASPPVLALVVGDFLQCTVPACSSPAPPLPSWASWGSLALRLLCGWFLGQHSDTEAWLVFWCQSSGLWVWLRSLGF